MPKQLPQFSGKQTISIGNSANDGTGDNLRSAFDKVNQNFDLLYGIVGLTDGFKFSRLYETPETYVSNTMVTVNDAGDGLVYRSINSGSDIVSGYTGDSIYLSLNPVISSSLEFVGDIRFAGNVDVGGNGLDRLYVSSGQVQIATKIVQIASDAQTPEDADAAGIKVNGGDALIRYRSVTDSWQVNKNILPETTTYYDLGSGTHAWGNVWTTNLHVLGNITADYITANILLSTYDLTVNNNATIGKDLHIIGNLTVDGNTIVKDTFINVATLKGIIASAASFADFKTAILSL